MLAKDSEGDRRPIAKTESSSRVGRHPVPHTPLTSVGPPTRPHARVSLYRLCRQVSMAPYRCTQLLLD